MRPFGDGPCVAAGEMPRAHGMAQALMTPAPATPGASRLKVKKAACHPWRQALVPVTVATFACGLTQRCAGFCRIMKS